MDNPPPGCNLTPGDEKRIMQEFIEYAQNSTKQGDTYYVVSLRWWKEWKDYVEQDASAMHKSRPQSIDNSDLLLDVMEEDCITEPDLRESLLEGKDFILLPQTAWKLIHKWYGGGPILARKVIDIGRVQNHLVVELYPFRLQLIAAPGGRHITFKISRKDSVGELYRKARELFELVSEEIRIWDCIDDERIVLLNDMDKRLDEAGLISDQSILLEVVDEGNSGSLGGSDVEVEDEVNSKNCTALNSINSSCVTEKGLKGLKNLGNTCFMNSALQCLVHTTELVNFFLEDFSTEINWKNHLGTGGKLAVAFGDLLKELWAPGESTYSPNLFKEALAEFAPRFAGYNQEDTQEFLSYLLDGIHEDLNRVLQKPDMKPIQTTGRPHKELANERWAEFKACNDSIITDLFYGQYRSISVCQKCSNVSATFDPFLSLTLPLPAIITRTMTVTVFSSDGIEWPTQYTISVPKHGNYRDVIDALSSACSLRKDEKLLLAEIYTNKIFRLLEQPFESISTIKDYDCLAAYRLPMFQEKSPLLILMHQHKEANSVKAQYTELQNYFGTPLIASIGQDVQTGADIQAVVQALLAPMLRNEHSSHGSHVESSFNLWLADEKGDNRHIPIEDDKPIPILGSCTDPFVEEDKPSSYLRSCTRLYVLLEWTDKELEKYDTKYIADVPWVSKSGFNKKRDKESTDLYTVFKAYHKEEELEEEGYCSRCKALRPSIKKLDFWRMPEILVLSLNRYAAVKSNMFVDFPIHHLDLTPFVAHNKETQRYIYELFAVNNHYGSMGFGHYTAYVKLESGWYEFDDDTVTACAQEESIKTSAAYVLFYRRVKSEDASMTNEGHANQNNPILQN